MSRSRADISKNTPDLAQRRSRGHFVALGSQTDMAALKAQMAVRIGSSAHVGLRGWAWAAFPRSYQRQGAKDLAYAGDALSLQELSSSRSLPRRNTFSHSLRQRRRESQISTCGLGAC